MFYEHFCIQLCLLTLKIMENRVSLGSAIKVTLLGCYRSGHCEVLIEKCKKNSKKIVTFGGILEKFL